MNKNAGGNKKLTIVLYDSCSLGARRARLLSKQAVKKRIHSRAFAKIICPQASQVFPSIFALQRCWRWQTFPIVVIAVRAALIELRRTQLVANHSVVLAFDWRQRWLLRSLIWQSAHRVTSAQHSKRFRFGRSLATSRNASENKNSHVREGRAPSARFQTQPISKAIDSGLQLQSCGENTVTGQAQTRRRLKFSRSDKLCSLPKNDVVVHYSERSRQLLSAEKGLVRHGCRGATKSVESPLASSSSPNHATHAGEARV